MWTCVNNKHLARHIVQRERQRRSNKLDIDSLILQAKAFGFEVNESKSLVIDFELVENTQTGVALDVPVSLLSFQHVANWRASVTPSPSRRPDPGSAPGWLTLWRLRVIHGYVRLHTVTQYGWELFPYMVLNVQLGNSTNCLYQKKSFFPK